jgi:hypothetical protein
MTDELKFPLKISDLITMDCDKDGAPEKVVWSSDQSLVCEDVPCFGFNKDSLHKPMRTVGEFKKYDDSLMAVDVSGRGSDATAYACASRVNGVIHITEYGWMMGGYDTETMVKLANVAKRNKVNRVIMESNYGGGSFSELLRPWLTKIHPCQIENIHQSKQKELRIIETLEPIMTSHRLVIDKQSLINDARNADNTEGGSVYTLTYQMAYLSRERGSLKHDDTIDAIAMACHAMVSGLAVHSDDMVKQVPPRWAFLAKFLDDSLNKVASVKFRKNKRG